MNNNQDLSANAVPAGPPAKRAADFNIDAIMENYKKAVDREIDRVSAKFNRNPNPKDGAETLKLLDQMAKTLLMHKPFRERSRRLPLSIQDGIGLGTDTSHIVAG
jgi:hypothetical protein